MAADAERISSRIFGENIVQSISEEATGQQPEICEVLTYIKSSYEPWTPTTIRCRQRDHHY